VGHLNIGAGRIIQQDILRINESIEIGEFFKNRTLLQVFENVKRNSSSLHLIGLLSDGGVHSDMNHIYALLKMAQMENVKDVYLHAFLDGRDTPPTSGIMFIKEYLKHVRKCGRGKIATIMGRYYGMDRDRRWDRTERAYRAMIDGTGEKFSDPLDAVQSSYDEGITDEFVRPRVIFENGYPMATIRDRDSIFAFNFRADRMRQITEVFTSENFNKFDKKYMDIFYATMTEYDEDYDLPVAFEPLFYRNILGEVLEKNSLTQLRIAETEKYAHVTYFFNGGVETSFPHEDRILIPSPKVATYDLQPEMSAHIVTEKVMEEIENQKYDFIVLNFANPDMVGHTGLIKAAIKAVEEVDKGLGKIIEKFMEINGIALITSDHGNVEVMINPATGEPLTSHTINPVPFIIVDRVNRYRLKESGRLSDIAPTVLQLLNIPKPAEMTGESLIEAVLPLDVIESVSNYRDWE
ncbi:MAG: 2,3-bisphosphoglycerate-independent phosphoglycerate mutase, partial [Fidelibacterota bacterium]